MFSSVPGNWECGSPIIPGALVTRVLSRGQLFARQAGELGSPLRTWLKLAEI